MELDEPVPASVDVSQPEDSSTSADLAWCLPFESFFGSFGCDNLLKNFKFKDFSLWLFAPAFLIAICDVSKEVSCSVHKVNNDLI